MATTVVTDHASAHSAWNVLSKNDERRTETMTEIWTPPTFCAGKVPQVIPGKSNDLEIEGDFPLDQIVIDRE